LIVVDPSLLARVPPEAAPETELAALDAELEAPAAALEASLATVAATLEAPLAALTAELEPDFAPPHAAAATAIAVIPTIDAPSLMVLVPAMLPPR
jgi:hypothetical protein